MNRDHYILLLLHSIVFVFVVAAHGGLVFVAAPFGEGQLRRLSRVMVMENKQNPSSSQETLSLGELFGA